MTQDEIIEMGIKADLCDEHGTINLEYGYLNEIIAFAKLVAQHEREACAEVCKKHADVYAGLEQNPTTQSAWAACIDNRDAIRARGQA
jgi:hypothetical protein